VKHLIICREMPPALSGGIGTYVDHIAALLAQAGETVHVIGQLWAGAERPVEERHGGRLIVHRLPFEDWQALRGGQPRFDPRRRPLGPLFRSDLPARCFAWQAALLAEELVESEGIDVIEAQDYEAPLWFFQLRRALAMVPRRRPACLVHLHSPTEFIARHNEWPPDRPGAATAVRLETESIRAADALLCPSRFLARQAEERYGLAAGAVHVIPLPLGGGAPVERAPEVWERGTVCYVGRLERRKGVVEWIDAAVAAAPAHPDARFDFIGDNVLGTPEVSGEGFVERRIPRALRDRFVFRGAQPRSALPRLLAAARIAVVPSRWENFPNSCVEAMISGLPVIATRQGGMAELIADGESGWLVDSAEPRALAAALERALATPPERLRAMGRRATEDAARLCDNDRVLASHLAFRAGVAARGAGRSLIPPEGDRAALRSLAAGRIPDPDPPPLRLPRPLRKALRSPRQAAADAWKALGRLTGRLAP
jgi:glycosyltransferase involved in cell wall biosynthesis